MLVCVCVRAIPKTSKEQITNYYIARDVVAESLKWAKRKENKIKQKKSKNAVVRDAVHTFIIVHLLPFSHTQRRKCSVLCVRNESFSLFR